MAVQYMLNESPINSQENSSLPQPNESPTTSQQFPTSGNSGLKYANQFTLSDFHSSQLRIFPIQINTRIQNERQEVGEACMQYLVQINNLSTRCKFTRLFITQRGY